MTVDFEQHQNRQQQQQRRRHHRVTKFLHRLKLSSAEFCKMPDRIGAEVLTFTFLSKVYNFARIQIKSCHYLDEFKFLMRLIRILELFLTDVIVTFLYPRCVVSKFRHLNSKFKWQVKKSTQNINLEGAQIYIVCRF